MKVALRCDRHRHAIVDTQTGILEIHCRQCSKAEGTPAYHPWLILDLIDVSVIRRYLEKHDGSDHCDGTEAPESRVGVAQ